KWLMSYFFFSSRRRHTRFDCDWSSDVCSSDLISLWRYIKPRTGEFFAAHAGLSGLPKPQPHLTSFTAAALRVVFTNRPAASETRSEERRVGKESRSRQAPEHPKKKKTTPTRNK